MIDKFKQEINIGDYVIFIKDGLRKSRVIGFTPGDIYIKLSGINLLRIGSEVIVFNDQMNTIKNLWPEDYI